MHSFAARRSSRWCGRGSNDVTNRKSGTLPYRPRQQRLETRMRCVRAAYPSSADLVSTHSLNFVVNQGAGSPAGTRPDREERSARNERDISFTVGAAVTTNPRGGEGVNDPANRKSGLALSAASSGLGRECIRSVRTHHPDASTHSLNFVVTQGAGSPAGTAAVTTNPRGGEGVNDPANRKSGLALSAASSGLGRECIRSCAPIIPMHRQHQQR